MRRTFNIDLRMEDRGGDVSPGFWFRPQPGLDHSGQWEFVMYPQQRGPAPLPEGAHLVFVLHGYGKSRHAGHSMSTGFSWLMELVAPTLENTHVLVPVAWPADPLKSASMATFGIVDDHSRRAGLRLARLIARQLPGRRLSFVAQSLGNRVALECIAELYRLGVPVSSFVSAAGAVENTSLTDFSLYRRQTRALERIQVLHSHNDGVLKVAYGIAGQRQVRRMATRMRYRKSKTRNLPALGSPGVSALLAQRDFNHPDSPELGQIELEKAGHGAYMPQEIPLEDWGTQTSLLKTLKRTLKDGSRRERRKAHQMVRSAWLAANALQGRDRDADLKTEEDALAFLGTLSLDDPAD